MRKCVILPQFERFAVIVNSLCNKTLTRLRNYSTRCVDAGAELFTASFARRLCCSNCAQPRAACACPGQGRLWGLFCLPQGPTLTWASAGCALLSEDRKHTWRRTSPTLQPPALCITRQGHVGSLWGNCSGSEWHLPLMFPIPLFPLFKGKKKKIPKPLRQLCLFKKCIRHYTCSMDFCNFHGLL